MLQLSAVPVPPQPHMGSPHACMCMRPASQWLNALVLEIWPFVDKGVCGMIKVLGGSGGPGTPRNNLSSASPCIKRRTGSCTC